MNTDLNEDQRMREKDGLPYEGPCLPVVRLKISPWGEADSLPKGAVPLVARELGPTDAWDAVGRELYAAFARQYKGNSNVLGQLLYHPPLDAESKPLGQTGWGAFTGTSGLPKDCSFSAPDYLGAARSLSQRFRQSHTPFKPTSF